MFYIDYYYHNILWIYGLEKIIVILKFSLWEKKLHVNFVLKSFDWLNP